MARKDRAVQVATVTQDRLDGLPEAEMFGEMLSRLEGTASQRPDIVCLPEGFAGRDPEVVQGPVTQRLGEWAKAHASYVAFGGRTREGDRVYNSAVLLDRAGKVVGQYHKMNPTEGEIESGVMPGSEAPVFQTDFGTIGFQICFDVNWRQAWAGLKERGAEIVFWPSAYPADRQLSALAWLNEYYVVSSTIGRTCRIYDISGEVLAASGVYQQWASATLYLGKRLFEIDYHTSLMRKVLAKYGLRVQVEWLHDEDWFTFTSVDPDLATEDVIAEFGLVPLQPYHARCEQAIEKARRTGVTWKPAAGE
jgi:beta-ureidopropionase